MNRVVVIDVVGLSSSVIGKYTPFLQSFIAKNSLKKIKPVLPAVTTSAQSTYLTGVLPDEHGIVANGWYDHRDAEIKFWKQSNRLVQGDNIWTTAKKLDPSFTCAQMCWWYNMYNDVEYSITPRPNYLADGRKIPDCYSTPASLRDELTAKLGRFPLFNFWGPNANIVSSQWIMDAAMYVEEQHQPTLNLVYIPHLDYCLQKFGPDEEAVKKELGEVDTLIAGAVAFFEKRGVEVMIISDYGIGPVDQPIHINRALRKEGLLDIRVERGLELLDAGASEAFAVADHQIAHVYCKTPEITARLKALLSKLPGVDKVLDKEEQKAYRVKHERSGDLLLLAKRNAWFTYYFWEDDAKAPDYARMVDIHKKPGYDPVEMFMTSKARAIYKLLLKKMGFRAVLDITPLDATLVKGSHGIADVEEKYYPVLISRDRQGAEPMNPTDIKQLMLDKIFGSRH